MQMMNKKIIRLIIIVFLIFSASYQVTTAYISDRTFEDSLLLAQEKDKTEEEKKEEEEKFLTKGDFILLITATDYMKEKIQKLLSWSIGYDVTKIGRAKLVPTIKYIKAEPIKAPPDGRTVIEVMASVDDPQGLQNIEVVRADLSSIGRLPNSILVDNGLWGDRIPNDGVYTIQTSIDPDIPKGVKEISVAVSNKKGWLTLGRTSLDVEKEPKILEAKAIPDRIRSDTETTVTFTVNVDNPGRIEDIKSVTINLFALGGKTVNMRNDGKEGDIKTRDNIFTYRMSVPAGISKGTKKLRVKVVNIVGGEAIGEIVLNIE